jgi:hypothetical protein
MESWPADNCNPVCELRGGLPNHIVAAWVEATEGTRNGHTRKFHQKGGADLSRLRRKPEVMAWYKLPFAAPVSLN